MPMIYVSERTEDLIQKTLDHLRKKASPPTRIAKTDVIQAAIEEYAKKLGVDKD